MPPMATKPHRSRCSFEKWRVPYFSPEAVSSGCTNCGQNCDIWSSYRHDRHAGCIIEIPCKDTTIHVHSKVKFILPIRARNRPNGERNNITVGLRLILQQPFVPITTDTRWHNHLFPISSPVAMEKPVIPYPAACGQSAHWKGRFEKTGSQPRSW